MHPKTLIAAISFSIIIGLSFLFVKWTLSTASPLETLAHRFTIAWVGASLILLFQKRRIRIQKQHLSLFLMIALLYPVLFFGFQVYGLSYISSSQAGIFQAIVPIFTLILASLLLKESSTSKQKLGIAFSVVGVVYLMINMNGEQGLTNFWGSLLIIFSSLSIAFYHVLVRKLTKHYTPFQLTYIITLFGFVFFNAFSLGSRILNGSVESYFESFASREFILSILYLSLLSSLLTSFLSNYVLAKIPAVQMSIFSNLATLITVLAGVVFLQEAFLLHHFIGAFLILLGIYFVNFSRKSKQIKEGNVCLSKDSEI
ncbi:DMT family transporter [Sporosarcina psychrophila]|uniref:DMT family transporter n=1 Tax=Sporosarcina psychrophila TaxID=1476 RepID=UPI000AE86107|nr:DMT family transporter [Sporosarcina psychrophila]